MKKLGYVFDILLLMLNSIGIVGALTEILQIPWKYNFPWKYNAPWKNDILWKNNIPWENDMPWKNDFVEIASESSGALSGWVFWLILFLFCVVSVLLWSGADGRRIFRRAGICAFLYAFLGLLFRKQLQGGILLLLQNAVENLNGRYQFHIAWTPAARIIVESAWSGEGAVWAAAFSALYLVFPFELLVGLFWKHGKTFLLLAGNLLWFTAACACDIFPGFFSLTFCVLGMAAALVQGNFRENPGAGIRAVTCVTACAGLVMAMAYFFLLPVLDRKYEVMEEKRIEFYMMVNNEWLPRVQSVFSGYGPGFGSGPDVTGELYRNNIFSYTANEVYRVTADRIPEGTIYLKGFVGASYGGSAWEENTDRELKKYYEEHGLELPGDYRGLVNLSYEALGRLQPGTVPGYLSIEELGGKGSYSLYPYGALLTEEFRAHGDGSVERKSDSYGYHYYFPREYGRSADLPGEWAEKEKNYRQYVYDSFLDYPEEDLPMLTEALRRQGIRRENISDCVLDIMVFLQRQAVYDLDAERNPSGTDFVEYFLFESQKGYCAHFASAGVLALRYCGIPARYAAGYAVTPWDFSADGEDGYTAVLTGKQAHAWVEIYLDTIGWIPVEMTPGAAALSGNSLTAQLEQAGQLTGQNISVIYRTDTPEKEEEPESMVLPEDDLLEENPLEESRLEENLLKPEEPPKQSLSKGETMGESQTGQEPAFGMTAQGNTEAEKESGGAVLKFLLYPLAGLLLLSTAVLMIESRKRRRREIFVKAGTRKRIFLLYRNLRNALRIMGCPGRLAVDEEAFWHRLRRIVPRITRQEYDTFCGILEKNTFGNMTPSGEELETVHLLHDKLIQGAYEKAPLYKKMLLGRYRGAYEGGI